MIDLPASEMDDKAHTSVWKGDRWWMKKNRRKEIFAQNVSNADKHP